MASRLHRRTRLVAGLACAILLLLLTLPAGPVGAVPPLVTTCADSGTGSLRAAVLAAASGDTIRFQAGLSCPSASPILLTSGTLTIATNLTIDGTGATIAVDGGCAFSNGACAGGGATVFTVNSGVTAALNALTIQHGSPPGGFGGGINNGGTLTVSNSTVSDNSAAILVPGGVGGGINNDGTLTVTNSTVSNNVADSGTGGGIGNRGTLTVTNSTFSGNSAPGNGIGGGIATFGGMATVTNSTFSGNVAYSGGGIINDSGGALTVTSSTFSGNSAGGYGGGIATFNFVQGTTTTLTNTLVATSPSSGDLYSTFTGTNNLIDDAASAGGFTDNDANHNIVGHSALLGPLGNYGGPTQTFPLLPGSPAINAGAAVGSGPMSNPVPSTDQRGLPRFGAPDIGAFEVQGTSSGLPNPLPNPKPPGTNQGVPAPLPMPPQPSGPHLGVPAPLPSRRP